MSKIDKTTRRRILSKDKVIEAAIMIADRGGLHALTMRKLGAELGVEGMALYHHFSNKSQLIDGMIDQIHGEIEIPTNAVDWKDFIRRRALSALNVVSKHSWSAALMEAGQTPGAKTLRDREAILKCFREAGFSVAVSVHAITILDIFIYGFVQQYANLPFSSAEEAAQVGKEVQNQFPADSYPYLAEMISQHMLKSGYDPLDEFYFGLDLILDGLARFEPR